MCSLMWLSMHPTAFNTIVSIMHSGTVVVNVDEKSAISLKLVDSEYSSIEIGGSVYLN